MAAETTRIRILTPGLAEGPPGVEVEVPDGRASNLVLVGAASVIAGPAPDEALAPDTGPAKPKPGKTAA